MGLTFSYHSSGGTPSNYGERHAWKRFRRYCAAVIGLLLPTVAGIPQVLAQQASQPGFDSRQTEKYFDNQTDHNSRGGASVKLPAVSRPDNGADTRPQFVLRNVSVRGVDAVALDRIAATY